jgi:hypothetical protein
MPQMLCRCGFVLDLTNIPAPSHHLLLKVDELEQLFEKILNVFKAAQANPELEDWQIACDVALQISLAAKSVQRCPNCGRLIVEWDEDEPGKFYLPEADLPSRGLDSDG